MTKVCPNCGADFDPADRVDGNSQPEPLYKATLDRTRFCSETCARTHENKSYYARHRDAILARVKSNKN